MNRSVVKKAFAAFAGFLFVVGYAGIAARAQDVPIQPPNQPVAPAAPTTRGDPTAPVTLTQTDQLYVMTNGLVVVSISKRNGDLASLKYRGIEFMEFNSGHPGGYWSHDPAGASQLLDSVTIDPATNGGERAEVSVKGISGGQKLGHPAGSGADGDFAADIDIRWSLGRGDSGAYTYCTFDHKPQYPNATMGEARYCMKLATLFDWMLVDAHHNMLYPPDAETGGDDKYNYTTTQFEHPAFGWASRSQHLGCFIVNPTVEYLTGPPTKVEFLCHRDTTAVAAPCALNYWRSSHYGGGGVDVAQGEEWTKVIGPFMIYCTAGTSTESIWTDAIAQQRKESRKWPYDWVSDVDYPHRDQRATVSGQMVLTDPLMPDAKMWNIRVGFAHADYSIPFERPVDINTPHDIQWQTDSKHYEFWERAQADGSFVVPNIRPGSYTMHVIADGVLGEFTQKDVTLTAGQKLDMGKIKWTPVRRGQQVWEIGIPNRNGSEFNHGDDYFHDGMANIYAELFPDDLNYVVGISDYRRDWFYLHVPHVALTPAADAPIGPTARRGGPFGGLGGFAAGAATTQPLGRGIRGGRRGLAATGPAATQPFARGARGAARGRGGAAPIASKATPWSITFNMPSAPHGKATLRLAIATCNTPTLSVDVNGKPAGQLDQLHTDSAIGRNGISGIWFEREFPFDASMMKAGANVLTLTVPAGGGTSGLIYDYLRMELDESAPAPAPTGN